MSDRITVCMVAPRREQCGVADYTDYLLPELRGLADVRHVVDAAGFTGAMNDVDVVHVQHQYFLFGGVAPWKNRFQEFADRVRVPLVMTAHEFVEARGNAAVRAAVRLTNRRNFQHRAVRRIIVHTEADRNRMEAAGIPSDRVAVIRHGIPPAPDLPPRRRDIGLDGGFVLTMFGFLSRRKGHALAIEAMRQLPQDVTLLLAGGPHPDDSTGYVEGLERLIRECRLEGRVRITGYLAPDEVAQVMSSTDLVIAPFTESSGSGSLALAFAFGKPVLASSIPPHLEIVRGTENALATFEPLHPTALAKRVSSLMGDPNLRAALAEGASRYAHAHSYRRMAEETVTIYRGVVGRSA